MPWYDYSMRKVSTADEDHWTVDYIPISGTVYDLDRSWTYYISNEDVKDRVDPLFTLYFLARVYYQNRKIVHLGDVWLDEDLRGKKYKGEKISRICLKKVIASIWRSSPYIERIYLEVHKKNIAAIRLYESLGFKVVVEHLTSPPFSEKKPGIQMKRMKRGV